MSKTRIIVAGTVALISAACSSDKTSGNGDAGEGAGGGGGGTAHHDSGPVDGGTGGKGGGGDSGGGVAVDGGKAAAMSGVAVDFSTGDATKNFDASKYPVLTGVKVCVYEDASVPCVTTDAKGEYSISLPIGVALYVSYEKTGFTPNLYAVTATDGTPISAPALLMTTTDYTDSFGTKGGAKVDATKGQILFGATWLGPSSTPIHEMFGATELFYLDGFSTTIDPPATVGPVFTSSDWQPDPSLTKASEVGWGFFQAEPGDYTLTFTRPGYTCGSTKTKVVAGHATTYVGTLCTLLKDGGVADAAPDAP